MQSIKTAFQKILILPFAVLVPMFASPAYAEKDFAVFLGAGAGMAEVDTVDAFEKRVQFKVAEVIGGARYKWIGVEGRVGQGLEDETVGQGSDPDTGRSLVAKTSIDSYSSTYVRLQFSNEAARVYGLYGQTTMSTTTEQNGEVTFRDIESSGTSYGLGAGIRINKAMRFNVEYRNLLTNELDDFSTLNFNLTIAVISL
jgi:hypothetical protein